MGFESSQGDPMVRQIDLYGGQEEREVEIEHGTLQDDGSASIRSVGDVVRKPSVQL